MPDPAAEPPALPPEPLPGPGTVTLSTSLLGDLQVPGSPEQAATLQALAARAAVYATRARGDGTRRTYRSAWRAFSTWCASLGREPLAGDRETIAMYAVHAADRGLSLSSLRVALAAIQAAHRLAGIALDLRHPRLVMLLEGIARTKGTRPARQATAAGPEALRRMLATRPGPETPLGARDRALLLLGFAGALRRSELVGLALGDVEVVPQRGLRLLIRRSKTDQRGAGQAIALSANPREPGLCPARALDAWLGFRRGGGDHTGGASDAALPLFVGLNKAGKLSAAALSTRRSGAWSSRPPTTLAWRTPRATPAIHCEPASPPPPARPAPTSPPSCGKPGTAPPRWRSATSGPPNSGATMPRSKSGRMSAVMSSTARHPRMLLRGLGIGEASPGSQGNRMSGLVAEAYRR